MVDAASGLAARSYLALAVGYRLLTNDAPWPGQVHDVKTAVRARAGEFRANVSAYHWSRSPSSISTSGRDWRVSTPST
jgi:acetyl esterase/lipase